MQLSEIRVGQKVVWHDHPIGASRYVEVEVVRVTAKGRVTISTGIGQNGRPMLTSVHPESLEEVSPHG